MRILVVGAGASIEEARRVNAPPELWPPTIKNFAQKLWDSPPNSFFNYWLPDYLISIGVSPGSDPTSFFICLCNEHPDSVNVERLFEFCWENRGKKFQGDWENLIQHGVLDPITFLLSQVFYENGVGIKRLPAGQLVAGRLNNGDAVLSLNYETLFEIAVTQYGHKLIYLPNGYCGGGIRVAKPHGSMNLLADEHGFCFAQPDCIGAVPSGQDSLRNWRAIVPPRFNKTYKQHPIAKVIFDAIANLQPSKLTFWGVGLTSSDSDLIAIYRNWCQSKPSIEVINPDESVQRKANEILNTDARLFKTIEEWLES